MRGTGNTAATQSAIKLRELGPRMELTLYKVQDGFFGGDVLYHKSGPRRRMAPHIYP